MIAPHGFHHVAVLVTDVERVAAFYREVLELPEVARFHHPDGSLRSIWVGARSGGDAGGGFVAVEQAAVAIGGNPGRGYTMVALAIEVSTREQVRVALERRGVPIECETDFTVYVRDPEGNLVGLSHYPVARIR